MQQCDNVIHLKLFAPFLNKQESLLRFFVREKGLASNAFPQRAIEHCCASAAEGEAWLSTSQELELLAYSVLVLGDPVLVYSNKAPSDSDLERIITECLNVPSDDPELKDEFRSRPEEIMDLYIDEMNLISSGTLDDEEIGFSKLRSIMLASEIVQSLWTDVVNVTGIKVSLTDLIAAVPLATNARTGSIEAIKHVKKILEKTHGS